MPAGAFCLFDGLEIFNRWQQYKVRKAARERQISLIATLHKASNLPIIYTTKTDWMIADQIVKQLAGSHYTDHLKQQARLAFDESHGNVREVFRRCYWVLAG